LVVVNAKYPSFPERLREKMVCVFKNGDRGRGNVGEIERPGLIFTMENK
jgi:hypothetical protein